MNIRAGRQPKHTYAVILVHADGTRVVFESGISKERAEEMRDILLSFLTDVRVVDQGSPVSPPAPSPDG